ncbi:MAG: NAD(P)/FAD-dependent oxidoreductase [Pikeienuella sp.]|uniref:NAD(P)/FAD-dependent oxidoreductase n=1 Tax=Pikeienuella sp. TaxID=2831957 RepID=UPI003919A212
MQLPPGFASAPKKSAYDVVIVGGAIMGSAAAWFLTENPDFDGSILVLERAPDYAACSTAHTNSCIRQQFSTELNIRISQFTADYVKNLRERMGDERIPDLPIRNFGYLYLADNEAFAAHLRAAQAIQLAVGAETRLLTAEEIAAAYPFYNVDDILLGSINTKDEGYWDGAAVFDWLRRLARERGAEYVADEVVSMKLNAAGTRVGSVRLAGGAEVACGHVVNCSGPRAARTARMAGIDLPVEPRKRYSWIFKAERPLDRDLPLTIDPSGVHVRENGGGTYLAGGHPEHDPAAEPDDFTMDHGFWEEHAWPIIATRIPQFEAVKVTSAWIGHYAMNVLDRNAIAGPHPVVGNFHFMNGFSGHGLQQAPAMGRGLAEWIAYGEYRSLDLSPFGFGRIAENRPIPESAVI